MRERFKAHRFNPKSEALLTHVQGILDEYGAQGFRLTLRQLYYQLVSRDIIPNTLRSYSRLGDLVGHARLAGLLDWRMIEDRGRVPMSNAHWDSPASIIAACASQYKMDKWRGQDWYIEVMIEKQALEGVVQPVCAELDVTFCANKGYSSLSAVYEASKRYQGALDDGKDVEVIYLGDHDPSGIDMTRDIGDRLDTFLAPVKVQRLALNFDQVGEYQPPPNPAKTTDSRFAVYVAQFGEESWELDALEPSVLQDLVRDEILSLRDEDAWEEAVEEEEEARKKLRDIAKDMK